MIRGPLIEPAPEALRTTGKIIAFPSSGIAYNECLYSAVRALGLNVVEGVWAGRWLHEHVKRGDLVHIHWPSFLYFDSESTYRTYKYLTRFIVFLELIRRRGARIVWTAHNLYPHDGGRFKLCHRVARRVISSRADVVLVHGPTAAAIVAKEFGIPNEKIRVIKHGHWIDFHPAATAAKLAREQLGIEAGRFVYSFVGTCKPYKNLEVLIKTFAELNDDSVLLIAGRFPSADYRACIDALLTKLPASRWRLMPTFIADEDIHRYVLAGNVLVLPFTEILTSGSAMLGLSLGRPVIAPNAGGLRDMIGVGCGLLYENAGNGLLDALQKIRHLSFSENVIIEHARLFDWFDGAKALADLIRV